MPTPEARLYFEIKLVAILKRQADFKVYSFIH